MKNRLMFLTLVLVAILILGACAPQSAPAPTPTPTPGPAPAAKAKAIKISYDMQKTSGTGQALEWLKEQINTKTNGQITAETYPAGTLGFKNPQSLDSIKAGVADIGHASIAANAKALAVSSVAVLPSTHFPQAKAGMLAAIAAHKEMLAKYPSFANDYKDFKIFSWIVAASYLPMAKKTKITVPADLKGLKIGCELTYSELVKSVGGVPVSIIPPEMYPNLDKGVVDGVITGFEQLYALRLDEVQDYFCEYYFAPVIQVLLWNKASWNSLSPDLQKILTDISPGVESFAAEKALEQNGAAKERITKAGKTIVVPDAEQTKLWDNLSAIPDKEWLDTMKSMGVNEAQEMLTFLKQRSAASWSQNK